MRKILIILAFFVALAITAFYAFNAYIYQQKQAETSENIAPYRGTLTGEYVCLPHTDQSGPQTLECALGMKTSSGEYFALDFSLMSQTPPDLQTGDTFSASGLITPLEMLSTDYWLKYPIIGIFSVTDSLQKL